MTISKLMIIRVLTALKVIGFLLLLWFMMVWNESGDRGFDIAWFVALVLGVMYIRASHKAAKLDMDNSAMSRALSIS